MKSKPISFLLLIILAAPAAIAQQAPLFAEDAGNKYWIKPDVVYHVENGRENRLDVIYPRATAAVPA